MKTLIATALVLSAGIAQAQSFAYEKQVGSAELFSTLATDGIVTVETGGNFAYQQAIGSPDLFPTLISDTVAPNVTGDRTVFDYQRDIGSNELDPSLSS